ncbi:unnamed protein product [Notodromas monacha]|uniref:Uncharacterized protein n=1 Tax=Notodromas monacha TaxID=399045 RepID=A0A7R9G8D9_9CRUS|nr:unnamed protein product [Notodromas monacha]CAG0913179.1 unnamed protein product [Notodromas monacha]
MNSSVINCQSIATLLDNVIPSAPDMPRNQWRSSKKRGCSDGDDDDDDDGDGPPGMKMTPSVSLSWVMRSPSEARRLERACRGDQTPAAVSESGQTRSLSSHGACNASCCGSDGRVRHVTNMWESVVKLRRGAAERTVAALGRCCCAVGLLFLATQDRSWLTSPPLTYELHGACNASCCGSDGRVRHVTNMWESVVKLRRGAAERTVAALGRCCCAVGLLFLATQDRSWLTSPPLTYELQ